jgi:hypothetical protein
VGVTAQVGEHMLRPGERRLAVGDPGLLAQLGEPRGKRRGLAEWSQATGEMQFAPVEGPPQAGAIAGAEGLRQGATSSTTASATSSAGPASAVSTSAYRWGRSTRVY